jgi:hypothetical protein
MSRVGILLVLNLIYYSLVGSQQSQNHPCSDGSTCHHLCERLPESSEYLYQCRCFEGFKFSSNNWDCERACPEGKYWDKISIGCKEIHTQCDTIDNPLLLEKYAQRYANIGRIGRGYDLVIGDPFESTRDDGIKLGIFTPLEQQQTPDGITCRLFGYDFDESGFAEVTQETKTITSIDELKREYQDVIEDESTFDTGTIQVTDLANSRKESSDTVSI